jgi:hypothetical protein
MVKVYSVNDVKKNYTLDELKRAVFMYIKSAAFNENGDGERDKLYLELQKYYPRGKCHLNVYYEFAAWVGEKFMKEGMGVSVNEPDKLVGKVILGIVNKNKPVLDGLCAYN